LEDQLKRGTAHQELCRDLLDAIDALSPSPPTEGLVETLSEREKTVLRCLATLLSVEEISRELFVSTNTVKTHIKHIYRKLGVGRRRDAVDRARALHLSGLETIARSATLT
jgi:LuxR family maltose regulon positive regulatory protein